MYKINVILLLEIIQDVVSQFLDIVETSGSTFLGPMRRKSGIIQDGLLTSVFS